MKKSPKKLESLNTATKKETSGGTLQGSGAKPKYNEPTKTIACRVPISHVEHVKSLLKTLLDGWSVK